MAGARGAAMHRRNFLQEYFRYSAAVARLAMTLVLATSAAMAVPLQKKRNRPAQLNDRALLFLGGCVSRR